MSWLAFSQAISSLTLFAGTAFLATINKGFLGSCVTGSTSFKGSKSNCQARAQCDMCAQVPEDDYTRNHALRNSRSVRHNGRDRPRRIGVRAQTSLGPRASWSFIDKDRSPQSYIISLCR